MSLHFNDFVTLVGGVVIKVNIHQMSIHLMSQGFFIQQNISIHYSS